MLLRTLYSCHSLLELQAKDAKQVRAPSHGVGPLTVAADCRRHSAAATLTAETLAAASQVCTFESFGILSPVPYPCTLTWCLESQIFHSPLPSHHELFPVLSDSVMHVGAG